MAVMGVAALVVLAVFLIRMCKQATAGDDDEDEDADEFASSEFARSEDEESSVSSPEDRGIELGEMKDMERTSPLGVNSLLVTTVVEVTEVDDRVKSCKITRRPRKAFMTKDAAMELSKPIKRHLRITFAFFQVIVTLIPNFSFSKFPETFKLTIDKIESGIQ